MVALILVWSCLDLNYVHNLMYVHAQYYASVDSEGSFCMNMKVKCMCSVVITVWDGLHLVAPLFTLYGPSLLILILWSLALCVFLYSQKRGIILTSTRWQPSSTRRGPPSASWGVCPPLRGPDELSAPHNGLNWWWRWLKGHPLWPGLKAHDPRHLYSRSVGSCVHSHLITCCALSCMYNSSQKYTYYSYCTCVWLGYNFWLCTVYDWLPVFSGLAVWYKDFHSYSW